MIEYEVEGKGNCLFGSLGAVLHDDQWSHPYVRKKLTYEMNLNSHKYFALAKYVYPKIKSMEDYNKFVYKMTKDKTWGGAVCLQAAANLYQVRIVIVKSDQYNAVSEFVPNNFCSKRDVYLSGVYYSKTDAHANALFPINDLHKLQFWDMNLNTLELAGFF